MSTRFPMNVLVMELASSLEAASLRLNLVWKPREENNEAQALTNEVFSGFDTANGLTIEINRVKFPILCSMLESGKSVFEQVA